MVARRGSSDEAGSSMSRTHPHPPGDHKGPPRGIKCWRGEGGEEWLGWPERVKAKGTLSEGDGATGGQPCPAERSEAPRRPWRETLRCAQGDKTGEAAGVTDLSC